MCGRCMVERVHIKARHPHERTFVPLVHAVGRPHLRGAMRKAKAQAVLAAIAPRALGDAGDPVEEVTARTLLACRRALADVALEPAPVNSTARAEG